MSQENPDKPEEEVFGYFNELVDARPVTAEDLHPNSILDAQSQYLCFIPIHEIANDTGIPYRLLISLVYKKGGWRHQRDLMHAEVKEQAKEKARKKLQKAYQVSIRLITSGLLSYEKKLQRERDEARKANPDAEIEVPLKDINEIGKLLTRLDKANLNAEDAVKDRRKTFTPKDLVKSISQDPYLKKAFISHAQAPILDDDEEFIVENDQAEQPSDSLAHPSR